MELWIRSQDKMKLVKVNYCYIRDWQDHFAIEGETFDSAPIVGEYKTKERALEVLDEIQNILKPHLIIKDSGKIIGTFEDTIIREGANYELKELSTYVYEMPEK